MCNWLLLVQIPITPTLCMPPAVRSRIIIFAAMCRTSCSSPISINSMLKLKLQPVAVLPWGSSWLLLSTTPGKTQFHRLVTAMLSVSLVFSLGWQNRDKIWPSAHKDYSGMGYTYLLDNASWPFYTVWTLQWLDMVLCLLLASSLFVLFSFPGPT